MLAFDQKILGFTRREIWFEPRPSEVSGADKVIFKSCTEKTDIDGYTREDFTTLTIDLGPGAEAAFNGFNKTCQNQIRKGEKHGIEVSVNRDHEEFCRLYAAFTKAKKLPRLPVNAGFLEKHGTLFTARAQGALISGSFFLNNGHTLRLYISASLRLDAQSGIDPAFAGYAGRMLMWRAIAFGCESGLAEFDLGGYYTGEKPDAEKEKINFFKEGFTRNVTTRYNYTKYYSKPMELLARAAGLLKRS